jgi:hypothetical protein
MMAFDKDQLGWFYIIENPSKKLRKVGITNSLETRIATYGKGWYLTFAHYHSGFFVSLIESAMKSWLSARTPCRKIPPSAISSGHTETYPITWSTRDAKMRRFLTNLCEIFS